MPVLFLFRWVAYALMTMASVMGYNRLLLLSDMPSVVIDGKSGYARTNQSWNLGRVLRDFEDRHWMDPQISKCVGYGVN